MQKALVLILILTCCLLMACGSIVKKEVTWKHLSTEAGDLQIPNEGNQQTSTAIIDVDGDGDQDFMITERTKAPAVVLYRFEGEKWNRYIVEAGPLRIEAGNAVHDIDGDGDLDVVFGGDGGSNEIWWWENPNPNFESEMPWTKRTIKSSGSNKHHDQMFGDFDGDGEAELVFWSQNAYKLYLTEIPENQKNDSFWEMEEIYSWSNENEPEQYGEYPRWKKTNEHEGFAKADVDGDGVEDIIGGGRWFKHEGNHKFSVHIIDDQYAFSRSAAGQFIKGGRPEVFLVVGDGRAPLYFYEWKNDQWQKKMIIEAVQDGHSVEVLDFNGDGNLDLFNAEMDLGNNPESKARILLGDGAGNFEVKVVSTGFANHESRMADLDGDGDYDILGKPYNWKAPRLDLWIQE